MLFTRKKHVEGQELEKIGDDPNEWMTHCRTTHPKMYGKAMSLLRNTTMSPTSTSPLIPAVSAVPVQSAVSVATAAPDNPPAPLRQSTPSTATPTPAPTTSVPAPSDQNPTSTIDTAE